MHAGVTTVYRPLNNRNLEVRRRFLVAQGLMYIAQTGLWQLWSLFVSKPGLFGINADFNACFSLVYRQLCYVLANSSYVPGECE